MEHLKSFLLWVYKWITVIVGIIAGLAVGLIPVLDILAGVDFSAFTFLTPERALMLTSGTAMLKAGCVWVRTIYGWMTGSTEEEE